ncbi:MAG: hypothetical protein IK054_00155 [Lachnospiraceae bacterium]|nr:hypothetical protein [Lachnospiraceae bacterium]MBR4753576.1 hypothetical protein [Lachnospiraceae bacterium]
MEVVFVLFIALVPICMGMFVRAILDTEGQNLADYYLCGILTLVVVSGFTQLAAILLNYSFTWYCSTLLVASLAMSVAGIVTSVALNRFSLKQQKKNYRDHVKAISRGGNVLGIMIIAFVFIGVLTRILLSSSILEGDFTLETINTCLSTDTIYKFNSLTGDFIENGMPIRQQILTLPILMGFFIKTFGLPATAFVLQAFPCFVAFLYFLALHRIGSFIYPDNTEKRLTFTGIFSFMILVGDISLKSPSFLLIYQGFTGYAFLACVILPYLFSACLRRKWGIAAVCIACEAFSVWTTYGVGFGVLVVVFFLIAMLLRKVIRNTPGRGKEQPGKV